MNCECDAVVELPRLWWPLTRFRLCNEFEPRATVLCDVFGHPAFRGTAMPLLLLSSKPSTLGSESSVCVWILARDLCARWCWGRTTISTPASAPASAALAGVLRAACFDALLLEQLHMSMPETPQRPACRSANVSTAAL